MEVSDDGREAVGDPPGSEEKDVEKVNEIEQLGHQEEEETKTTPPNEPTQNDELYNPEVVWGAEGDETTVGDEFDALLMGEDDVQNDEHAKVDQRQAMDTTSPQQEAQQEGHPTTERVAGAQEMISFINDLCSNPVSSSGSGLGGGGGGMPALGFGSLGVPVQGFPNPVAFPMPMHFAQLSVSSTNGLRAQTHQQQQTSHTAQTPILEDDITNELLDDILEFVGTTHEQSAASTPPQTPMAQYGSSPVMSHSPTPPALPMAFPGVPLPPSFAPSWVPTGFYPNAPQMASMSGMPTVQAYRQQTPNNNNAGPSGRRSASLPAHSVMQGNVGWNTNAPQPRRSASDILPNVPPEEIEEAWRLLEAERDVSLQEEDKAFLYVAVKYLREIVKKSEAEPGKYFEMAMPVCLNSYRRMLVHRVADKVGGTKHFSSDTPNGRQMHVWAGPEKESANAVEQYALPEAEFMAVLPAGPGGPGGRGRGQPNKRSWDDMSGGRHGGSGRHNRGGPQQSHFPINPTRLRGQQSQSSPTAPQTSDHDTPQIQPANEGDEKESATKVEVEQKPENEENPQQDAQQEAPDKVGVDVHTSVESAVASVVEPLAESTGVEGVDGNDDDGDGEPSAKVQKVE